MFPATLSHSHSPRHAPQRGWLRALAARFAGKAKRRNLAEAGRDRVVLTDRGAAVVDAVLDPGNSRGKRRRHTPAPNAHAVD